MPELSLYLILPYILILLTVMLCSCAPVFVAGLFLKPLIRSLSNYFDRKSTKTESPQMNARHLGPGELEAKYGPKTH